MNTKEESNIIEDIFIVDSENIHESELVQQCFDIVGVFVVAVDLNGNITLANTKAAKLLKKSKEEIVGKNFINNFITEEKREVTQGVFDSVIKGHSFYKDNTRYYLSFDGEENRVIESKNVTIRDKNKKILGILVSGQDITDYLKRQSDLQTDLSLYRLLANNIPDINLFLFDTSLKFVLVEGNEMKNNDMSRDYFEDNRLQDLPDNELKEIWTPLFQSALQGNNVTDEYQYNNYYYYIWVLPVYSRENEIKACVAITQNITEDKQLERKLKKSKEEAEKANKAKSDFLARVSHEIRTPLNAILGFTEQLMHSELNEQQKEYITIIDKSSEHLLSLINDILVLSKIEARQIRFDKSPFKLDYTVRYVCEALQVKATEKNIGFKYYIDEKLDKVFLGDPFRLRQVLINILGNAIKFTHHGYVKLKCILHEENGDEIKVRFEVQDTGIGISPENLTTIFERFKQADVSITRKYGGTGLGLAICKNLIELQRGSLSVSSEKGVGTTFTFVLPYQKGKKEDIVPHDSRGVDSLKLKGKKVLLVDDDSFNRLLAKTMLDKFKCLTDIAKNGAEAIEKLQAKTYDIVLLDIHMQTITGLDVARFLRKEKNNKTVKILAVTAAVMKDDIQHYYQVGINDFLIKPYKEGELFNKMCDLLSISISQQKEVEVEMVTGEKLGLYNLEELKKMANGNKAFINNMLTTFIENSENAIDLFRQYLEQEDWQKIGENAHRILPSYRHLEVRKAIDNLYELKTKTIVAPDYTIVPELLDNTVKSMEDAIEELRKELD